MVASKLEVRRATEVADALDGQGDGACEEAIDACIKLV